MLGKVVTTGAILVCVEGLVCGKSLKLFCRCFLLILRHESGVTSQDTVKVRSALFLAELTALVSLLLLMGRLRCITALCASDRGIVDVSGHLRGKFG